VLDSVPSVDVTLLAGKSVRRISLLAALREHDVVHYAGHSRYDAAMPARSGWQLADGVLTAAEIAKLRPAPVLVFSNSCEAGRARRGTPAAATRGHAFGIGSAFLLAGVQNYVGTFWVVHDEESLRFASTCYRALATGASLGHALLDARHAIVAQRGWQGLTWASYLLYGDPAFVPMPQGAALPMPPPTPATAPAREYRYAVSVSTESQTAQATPIALAPSASHVVGRAERSRAAGAGARLRAPGTRSVVFASGPPGIGKTTLVDAFLERARARGDWLIAAGSRWSATAPAKPTCRCWKHGRSSHASPAARSSSSSADTRRPGSRSCPCCSIRRARRAPAARSDRDARAACCARWRSSWRR
jgi:hypothetical protein